MMRSLTIRLLIVIFVVAASFLFFSYIHVRAAKEDNSNGEGGKCGSGKTHQTEYILWESLTRNLLVKH
jgi:hypothetical protein